MIHPEDFVHPEDQSALKALKAIPAFDRLVKGFLKYGAERMIQGINLASKIRLSPSQLPEIYTLLPPICRKLDIDLPQFYLEMNPIPNAYTMGDSIISITVTSGLITTLSSEEVQAVLAHECSHIACRHCLYRTMARLLLDGADIFSLSKFGDIARLATLPLRFTLLFWYRQSELSADRGAALCCGETAMIGSLIRLTGGPQAITQNINLDEVIRQANDYEALKRENKWDQALQFLKGSMLTHPFSAVRIRELLSWVNTPQFKELKAELALRESAAASAKASVGNSTVDSEAAAKTRAEKVGEKVGKPVRKKIEAKVGKKVGEKAQATSNSPTATRTDSNSPTATRTDSNSPTATRTDSNSPTATRTDSNSPTATRTEGSSKFSNCAATEDAAPGDDSASADGRSSRGTTDSVSKKSKARGSGATINPSMAKGKSIGRKADLMSTGEAATVEKQRKTLGKKTTSPKSGIRDRNGKTLGRRKS